MSVTVKMVAATRLPHQDRSVGGADAYRANLEACRRMARHAPNQQEKGAWLDMAESWRLLIITDPRSAGEGFDVTVRGHSKGSSLQNELELGDLIAHFCSKLPSL
jgi:hypothetical protein